MGKKSVTIEAVKQIGLRQISEMDMSKFGEMQEEAEMFTMRLKELKKYAKENELALHELKK